jgi:hypothetical protein
MSASAEIQQMTSAAAQKGDTDTQQPHRHRTFDIQAQEE